MLLVYNVTKGASGMKKGSLQQFFPAILIIVSWLLMAVFGSKLANARLSQGIVQTTETPWVRYVMVGLGGFRGIISEILWLRATRLQEQGRYFELVQLTDWINALDPKAADAWAFNAWNLAYNISAMIPDHNSRQKWVEAGISLMRDKAIPADPTTPSLYRELGWLYQNKIGSSDDPAHITYKLALAREVESVQKGEQDSPKLDQSVVAEIENRFGKIDWRLPQSHAIYWAWKGLALNPTGFELEALRRMVQQNLVVMITSGKFTGDTEKSIWSTEGAYELLPNLMSYYEEGDLNNFGELKVYCIFLDAISKKLLKAGKTGLAAIAIKRLQELGGIPKEE